MRAVAFSFSLTLVLVASGCGGEAGPRLVECKGTVTYEGKPVPGATVTFMVPKSPIAMGTTDSSGKFVITTGGRRGAPVGEAAVGIVKAPESTGPDMTQMKPGDMQKMQVKQVDSGAKQVKSPIPEKYGSPESSGLTAAISEDPTQNDFEFILAD